MKRLWLLLIVCATAVYLPAQRPEQVHYFPNVMYGHILAGTGASRYETTLILTATTTARAQIDVFNDSSEPMSASFIGEDGDIAETGSSFNFTLQPGRPLRIKIDLAPDDSADDVAVRTGWATVRSADGLQASELLRITTADGKVLTRQLIASQRSQRS